MTTLAHEKKFSAPAIETHEHISPKLKIATLSVRTRVIVAALTSQRTNLSPFTKGCRERGVSMRISDFFSDPQGPPTMKTSNVK